MKRWQDPPIETRSDVPRPYYFIRPYVPQAGSAGLERNRKRIPLGFCDETSMRKAQERKQEIMSSINQGKFILQAQIHFGDLVAKYREARLPRLSSTTRAKYVTHLENHILPVFAKAELVDIDRQSVEAWLNREATKHTHTVVETDDDGSEKKVVREYAGLGWWALADLRNIMSAVFKAAKDWGLWQGERPSEGVKLGPKEERREKRIPKAPDLQRFLAAIPETCILPADTARYIVLTAVATGLRVSEVLGLEPGDIDVAAGTLAVRRAWRRGEFGPPKSKASRRVRQVGPLCAHLAALGRDKIYIFEREPGMPPDDRDLQQYVFRPAAESVGIYFAGFGMHTFRRCNVTWRQTIGGATVFEAMKAAGHARPDVTWEYFITDDDRERQQVEAILAQVMPEESTKGGRPN